MFGSILSCTDTVAVLSLLKEVGAPKKFNSLIEGESLLNDGSCMVLFEIASDIVKGQEMTILEVIKLFFSLTIGGTALGILFGIIATIWLKKTGGDEILSVNVTFFTCFILYFVSENVDLGFRISGNLKYKILTNQNYIRNNGFSIFGSFHVDIWKDINKQRGRTYSSYFLEIRSICS